MQRQGLLPAHTKQNDRNSAHDDSVQKAICQPIILFIEAFSRLLPSSLNKCNLIDLPQRRNSVPHTLKC
jgi:hypothetical protein